MKRVKCLIILVIYATVFSVLADEKIFPQFGRWKENLKCENDQNRERRTVWDRLADYYHPCVLRAPLREVPKKSIVQWKNSRFKNREMKTISRGRVIEMKKVIMNLEEAFAQVSAECFRYKIQNNATEYVKAINNLYTDDNFIKWEWLLQRPNTKYYKSSENWFWKNICFVDDYLHVQLDKLDKIHIAEFEDWKLKNHSAFLARQQLQAQKTLEGKMQADAAAMKVRIANAEKAASDAEARAAQAEERAAMAEQRAAEAQCDAANAWERANENVSKMPPPPPKCSRGSSWH